MVKAKEIKINDVDKEHSELILTAETTDRTISNSLWSVDNCPMAPSYSDSIQRPMKKSDSGITMDRIMTSLYMRFIFCKALTCLKVCQPNNCGQESGLRIQWKSVADFTNLYERKAEIRSANAFRAKLGISVCVRHCQYEDNRLVWQAPSVVSLLNCFRNVSVCDIWNAPHAVSPMCVSRVAILFLCQYVNFVCVELLHMRHGFIENLIEIVSVEI